MVRDDAERLRGRSLHLVGWWPGPADVNGIFIREHIKAILPHMDGEVLHVEVLKSGPGLPTVERSTTVEDGITVHRIQIRTWLRRFGIADMLVRRSYRKFIGQRRAHFDLLHVHVRTEVTAQVIAMAERSGLPIVVTEHNSFYHLGIKALPPAEQARERRAIRRWFAHPLIRAVMPVSADLARVLVEDHGLRSGLITVVPNVAAGMFRPGSGPPPGPFRLLLAAVWRPPKDHDVFIRALAGLPDGLRAQCRVDWVGYGPDMHRIRERCTSELRGMDIRFPGRLEKVALADLMRKAHVFVLPTRADNLPCVVLESLCCGTPVVSMAVNGVPELVNEKNGVLVPPGDPAALGGALAGIMNGSLRFDRAEIARQAIAHYSAEAVGARIAGVLAAVLQDR